MPYEIWKTNQERLIKGFYFHKEARTLSRLKQWNSPFIILLIPHAVTVKTKEEIYASCCVLYNVLQPSSAGNRLKHQKEKRPLWFFSFCLLSLSSHGEPRELSSLTQLIRNDMKLLRHRFCTKFRAALNKKAFPPTLPPTPSCLS